MQHSNLDTVNKLFETGELKQLIVAGIGPVKVMLQRDIANYVATHGDKKEDVANKFGVCRTTVYKALTAMK